MTIDGQLTEWNAGRGIPLSDLRYDYGTIIDANDLSGTLNLSWSRQYLYIALDAVDNEVIGIHNAQDVYKDDCIEIFVDPGKDGFRWSNNQDVQIGIALDTLEGHGSVNAWSWCQRFDAIKQRVVKAKWRKTAHGYVLEAAVSLAGLHITPARHVRCSIAVHDADRDDKTEEKRITYLEEINGKDGRLQLGVLKFV